MLIKILVENEYLDNTNSDHLIQTHKASIITLVFAADKDSVSVTFDQNPGEEDDKGKGIGTLLYRIKGFDIVFYP